MTKPPISVPTESRQPISHDDALTAAQALIDYYFYNPGRVAVQCRIPRELTDTDVLLTDYILQQKQLAVGRQPQMDDVMRYLESENFGDIATDHKDGGEFCISDAILSFVRFWETQASLPVGESHCQNCVELQASNDKLIQMYADLSNGIRPNDKPPGVGESTREK